VDTLTTPGRVEPARGEAPSGRPALQPETWIALALVAAGVAAAWAWHGAGMELFLSGLGGFCL
jgi:hypothetical protein